MPRGRLKLEITESVLMSDPEAMATALYEFKQRGIDLSLDDFGTGYSSLSYLHRFPLDVLKIDRSFVSRMLRSPEALRLVRSIIELSHDLGLEVVAEGVEASEESDLLRQLGCDSAQGYYYSRPGFERAGARAARTAYHLTRAIRPSSGRMARGAGVMDSDLQRGFAHARAALAQMELRQVAPTPENFKVWYGYCSGSARALKRTIDVLISNGQDFTPNVCSDLYERFFGNYRQSEKARLINQRLEASVQQALAMLNSVGEEARHYTETLGERAASLGKAAELVRVRDVIHSVMSETQEMMERSTHLEHELTRSSAEIRALRKQVEDISREALTDALTGIGNRKLFDQRLKQVVANALEQGIELSAAHARHRPFQIGQ